MLYDRTKTVVRAHVGRERSLGENVFHPEALASAHHYGFSLRLCKAYRPQTKGKVESDVPYVRERLLRAHAFASYEHANRAWQSWNEDIARRRVHGTHGEVVAVRAERDRAALGPLPRDARTWSSSARRASSRATGCSASRAAATPSRTRGPASASSSSSAPRRSRSTRPLDGRRLARHERGRPARVLPDPVENSVSLAQVLSALPGSRGAPPAAVGLPGPDRWLS